MRMKRERLQFLETNEEAEQNQEPERPILSEEISTPRTRDNSHHFSDRRNRQNLDDSVYDFQPMEGKYSLVKSKFGKFSVGVGHKKIKSRGKLI